MITVFIFKTSERGMQYGIGTYIRELTEAFQRSRNLKIYLISYYDSECKEVMIEEMTANFIKVNIPSPKQSNIYYENIDKRYAKIVTFFLSPIIKENENILFHFNSIDALPVIKILKKKYEFPIITVAHIAQWQLIFNGNKQKLLEIDIDTPKTDKDKVLALDKEYYMLSNHIITVTQYMKDFLTNTYNIDKEKITVIPNGISETEIKTFSKKQKENKRIEWGFNDKDIIILFIGRIEEAKGIYFILDGFIKACKEYSNLHLVLAGNGLIGETIKKCQIFQGKIHFTEFLNKEKINELYAIADIGINLSMFEQCPYTILEMMANKIPIILSNILGINEICDRDTCIFIEPEKNDREKISFNADEIKQAILTLIVNKEKTKRIVQLSYKKYLRFFTSSLMSKRMENIYTHVLESS